VQVQREYVDRASGTTVTLERSAAALSGRWSLNAQLPAQALA